MVYDITKYSFNKSMYAPWFPMSSVESYLRAVEGVTYTSNCDVG